MTLHLHPGGDGGRWAIYPDGLSVLAARFYAQFRHLEIGDPQNGLTADDIGYPWAVLCAALAAPMDDTYDLIAVADVPFGPLFDPELALATLGEAFATLLLPHTGMYAGVVKRTELPAAGQRLRIAETSGANRGKPSAIEGAARQRLVGPDGTPGSARVYLTERVGDDAYVLTIATWAAETPDEAGTRRDIAEQMPAGRIWTYAVITGGTYGDLYVTHLDYADVKATFATYADLREDPSVT